jgi:hypothetical protein
MKIFDYKVEQKERTEAKGVNRSKVLANKHFGTSAYSVQFFYKYVTRLIIPVNNEKQ